MDLRKPQRFVALPSLLAHGEPEPIGPKSLRRVGAVSRGNGILRDLCRS